MTPRATYRLQLHQGCTLDDAVALVPYLARLGVSHLYTSPFLQAAEGSTHGYDVVDHTTVSTALGGEPARRRLAGALAEAGLGHVVDVVPNHMAVAPGNRWFEDVLEHGPSSRHASVFDVDWDPPQSWLRNRILLPILDDHYGRVLEDGRITVERHGARCVVSAAGRRLPVAPRSLAEILAAAAAPARSDELAFLARAFDRLPPAWVTEPTARAERSRDAVVLDRHLARALEEDPRLAAALDGVLTALNGDPDRLHGFLERQHYRLAGWRSATERLDYRRFFDIDDLIGLRVEDPEVFDATHELVLAWVAAGEVDGLRIDHPDGLRAPGDYLRRLRALAPDAWIVIEKILEGGESLRPSWPVDGTTGYEALAVLGSLHVDPRGRDPLLALEAEFVGPRRRWEEVVDQAKHRVVDESLGTDVHRLTALLVTVAQSRRQHRDLTRRELRDALVAVLVSHRVYRTYLGEDGTAEPEDRAEVLAAIEAARRQRPDLDPLTFGLLEDVLLARLTGEAETELRMRLQQLTGPVMAKGVEDTAFYRWNPLASLAEVGGDPTRWGIEITEFHRWCTERQTSWPASMLALSTHDTKRSEDVRARIGLLSEIPERWSLAVRSWWSAAERHRSSEGPAPALEYLLHQTLVGAHPIGVERLAAFAEKASREAKTETSWRTPDPAYDRAVRRFVEGICADEPFLAEVDAFVRPLVGPGRLVSLSQKLIQLTVPGVPDLYQGSELWDLSLVDPDNRRPVDWGRRAVLLERLTGPPDPEAVLAAQDSGLPKLWVTHRALAARARRPAAFGPGADGRHDPLPVAGRGDAHLVAFARGGEVVVLAPRLPLGLGRLGGWGDTMVSLPRGPWEHALTGERIDGGPHRVAELLARFPVGLLWRPDP
jgi:(1->4)-alpha-D-glucan 1-alpha-D-glucosylmutase